MAYEAELVCNNCFLTSNYLIEDQVPTNKVSCETCYIKGLRRPTQSEIELLKRNKWNYDGRIKAEGERAQAKKRAERLERCHETIAGHLRLANAAEIKLSELDFDDKTRALMNTLFDQMQKAFKQIDPHLRK